MGWENANFGHCQIFDTLCPILGQIRGAFVATCDLQSHDRQAAQKP